MAGITSRKFKTPRLIRVAIALALGLLLVDRGVAHLYVPQAGSKDVVLYRSGGCPECESLRLRLRNHNVPHVERDVRNSLDGMLGWWALGRGRGVPLSVIGEKVVYGYDLDRFDAALGELGYVMTETFAESAPEADPPPVAAAGGDAAVEEEAAGTNCEWVEDFEAFYARFKAEDEFRLERTEFPLRKRIYSGSGAGLTEEVFDLEQDQILDKDELVYLDQGILSTAGYSEGIYMNSEDQADIRMGPEDGEPLTIHKFHKVSGCWYLYEFVSYENSGSTNILAL